MKNNHEENREPFGCPSFGHCFCPALRGDSLPFRRLGGECAGDHDKTRMTVTRLRYPLEHLSGLPGLA